MVALLEADCTWWYHAKWSLALALEKENSCNEEQSLERLNCYWLTCKTAGDGDVRQDYREECHNRPAREGLQWAH